MRRLATLGFVIAAAALTAAGQLRITTTTLPTAIIGQPYPNISLQATGDPGPLDWSSGEGGTPPPNFLILSSTGTPGTFCYAGTSCPGAGG